MKKMAFVSNSKTKTIDGAIRGSFEEIKRSTLQFDKYLDSNQVWGGQ